MHRIITFRKINKLTHHKLHKRVHKEKTSYQPKFSVQNNPKLPTYWYPILYFVNKPALPAQRKSHADFEHTGPLNSTISKWYLV